MLYNHANARFQTNPTTNHITGNSIHIIEFKLSESHQVCHQIAVRLPNNNAATQTHIIIPITTFQKKDHAVTSFGALSNIAISGFFIAFFDFKKSFQIWVLQIGCIVSKLELDLSIVYNK